MKFASRTLLCASFLAAFSLAWPTLAKAQPAAVVKVTHPMSVDADSGQWSSLTAVQPIEGRLGPVGSFKLAYDDANLYALVTANDPTPLKNGSQIVQEMLKGGDAIGLCFGSANGAGPYTRVMLAQIGGHSEIIAMRPQWKDRALAYTYFTPAGGTVGMDFVGSLRPEGAQVAFSPTPGGYLAQVLIPWPALGVKPAAGLKLPFDVQVIFSDAAGTTNADTAWWHSAGSGPYSTTDMATEARLYPEAWGQAQLFETDPGPQVQRAAVANDPVFGPLGIPIRFTLPRASQVSVIVRDKNGWVVRELLRAQKMSAGPQTIFWDGRDRWGAPEPPGTYDFRVGYFPGLTTTFYGSAGNSAFPPYRTADGLGSIGGMHGGPEAVAGGQGMTMYLLNGGEEGQQSLRKIDITTGKSLWFHSVGGFGMGQSVASGGDFAYMIYAANKVTSFVRMDEKTGHNAPIGTLREPLVLGDIETQGLAIADGKAYYSVPKENRIGVIDLATGEKGKDIPIDSVRGLCTFRDGTLLVCKGTQVTSLNLQTLEPKALVTGLEEPSAVAVDRSFNVYVADLGKSQQIKKYSSQGQFITAIGVPEGRGLKAAPYLPMAFRGIKGLAVGPDENLWAVEPYQPPRRFARISLDGKWIQDIYGPTRCGDTVGFDLDNVSSVWYMASATTQGQFINANVDYDAYAKSPNGATGFKVRALWRMNQSGTDEEVTPDLMLGQGGLMVGGYNRCAVFTATNGKRYFWIDGSGARTGLWLWDGTRWKPVATVGGTAPSYWSDQNGDGLVQPNETSNLPAESHWNWIARDLTLYNVNGSLKPVSVSSSGVPDYAGQKLTPYLKGTYPSLSKDYFDVGSYATQMMPGSSDDSDYFSENNGPHQNRDFWDRASENRIVKVKDGRVQWIVGHHDGTMAHTGDQIISFGIAGEVDGVVMVSEVASNFVAYTTDGLALGWALTDKDGHRADASLGGNSIYVENAAPGVFVKDPKTGKRLLLVASSEDVRILNVTGVFGDDLKRIDGQVVLSAPLPRAGQVTARATTIPYSTWSKSIYEHYRATNVDGYDYEWAPDVASLPISDGKSLVGEIRLRRDAGNLCVFGEVLGSKPFPAALAPLGTDAGKLFGSNDGVELLLGSATGEAGRSEAGPGDTRLFFTATRDADGRPVGQVLACKPASVPVPPSPELSEMVPTGDYRGAGTTGPLDLHDGLKPVPGAVIRMRDRFDGKGYTFEAEVPLALVPELAHQTSVTYVHAGTTSGDGTRYRKRRFDLGPVLFNAAIWRSGPVPQRLAWQPDGFEGTDPTKMNPAAWGFAGDPLPVLLSIAGSQNQPPALRYETSRATQFSFGTGPTVEVKSAIFGGGWFNDGGLHFLTSPPREGFSISAAGEAPVPAEGNWRTSKLDMSAIGIGNTDSLSQPSLAPGQMTGGTVQVKFPAGHSGQLHILWGAYTGNSSAGANLKIEDTLTGEVLNATNHPELSFNTVFNGPFQVHETVVSVSGSRNLKIGLAANPNTATAYFQGLWIEPNVQTSFAAGATVSLAAYTGSALAPLRGVEFYEGDHQIGEAEKAPYVVQWKPPGAGSYRITARTTDEMGSRGTSAVTTIEVSPPSTRQ